MSGDDATATEGGYAREYSRVVLVGVCAVAIVLATAVLPLLAPAGDSPAESLVPLPPEGQRGPGPDAGLGASGDLGALNPGTSTTVGGVDTAENPFQSRDTDVHFTAQSTDAAYWRTGAYETYTGSGWETDTDLAPYDGPIPPGVGSGTGTEVRYAVTLERSASSLPTVWRPRTVSREGLMVTDAGAIRADGSLPAGTAYQGSSVRPAREPAVLRTSGRDYPAAVEERYTALPPGTRQRLGPFTDDLTAGSDSPTRRRRRSSGGWRPRRRTR
ncbi:DUF3488 domain-containing protein [Halomicroarcula sp. GCM10025709]|uniref:DUF3488 domain-containing protein n=1 Tax=Halomicroarcula sp. GCM10025709 TaxID=3252669 RepID=UPI003613F07C